MPQRFWNCCGNFFVFWRKFGKNAGNFGDRPERHEKNSTKIQKKATILLIKGLALWGKLY
jgi:hypothetical protein